MKNFKKRAGVAILFLLSYAMLIHDAMASSVKDSNQLVCSQEELVNLSRPSVVRIVQHVTGQAILKPFTLDLDKMTITEDVGTSTKVPIDEYMTGSGFVVSSNGYIMTNSHVISLEQIKAEIISSAVQSAIMDASIFAVNFNEEISNSKPFEEYGQRINDYLLKNGIFDFKQEIVVLDPSSKKEKILDLVADGFPISIISINDDYNKNFMDVALIKIDQQNLPTLPLSQSTSVKTGEKIGVFGFPTKAELNDKSPLVSTFSQGVVSAIKESENKDFEIIQADAKISEGSSGSPMLNESGEVIGMITYQTNKLDAVGGDNFAFAIPIDVVQEGVKKYQLSREEDIKFDAGTFNAQFSAGLGLLHDVKCKSALPAFENAKNVNSKFNVIANIAPYEKRCQELISSGQSIDSKWDKAKQILLALDGWMWAIVVLLLSVITVITAKLFSDERRIVDDENEISTLEKELKQNEKHDIAEQAELDKIEEELKEVMKKKS